VQRTPVTSTNVAEIGYDDSRRILEVLFKNGTLYQYFDVPPQEYQALLQAGSLGQYLNANIKGRFRYARV
jgi:KTSC domain